MRFLPVSALLVSAVAAALAPPAGGSGASPHNEHRGVRPALDPSSAELDKLIGEMDQLNMRVMVNLGGRQGQALAVGRRRSQELQELGAGPEGWAGRSSSRSTKTTSAGSS